MTATSPLLPRASTESSGEQFLDLIATPFASQINVASFVAALGYSFGVSGFLAILFCVLRPRISTVYAPRAKYADQKHAPPAVGKGFFSWIEPIKSVKESALVEEVGLDATVFLRFMRMTRNIFLCLTVIGCGILIPVSVTGYNQYKNQWPDASIATINRITPQWIPYASPLYWTWVVLAYAFNVVICGFLWTNYKAVTKLRRQYFESYDYRNSLHSRTLLVTQIPKPLRTDDGIIQIMESAKSTEDTPRTAIARNTKELPQLIEEYEETVHNLEEHLARYLSNPNKLPASRPMCKPDKRDRAYKRGQRVDAIEYYTSRMQELEREIYEIRESIDKRNPLPYGFASYTHIEDAHSVAYAARKKGSQGTLIRQAPKPSDLIWKNLPVTRGVRRIKHLWSSIFMTVLTVLYIAPNMMTAIFLSNLSNLGKLWPAFKTNLYAHPIWWGIVQGIASPTIQTLFYLILPTIFRRLSQRSGDMTKTSRERHVMNKLYSFFVFNNLIVFSLFAATWTFVSTVIEESRTENAWDAIKDAKLVTGITTALYQNTAYWISWQMQRNLGSAIDLIQAWSLIVVTFKRHFLNPTPREMIEFTAPQPFMYAEYYNNYLFIVTVGLAYGTLQPLMLPVTALFFLVDNWLKKYLLQYVFITKTESGGAFWRNLFNRFVFATLLFDVVVALLVSAQSYTWTMLECMAPLPFLLLAFKIFCARSFDKEYHYYSTRSLAEIERGTAALGTAGELKKAKKNTTRVAVRFGHPALYKKLITPMVHAKSQHLLKEVYHGRVDAENETGLQHPDRVGFSDIYMNDMSADQPGKPVEVSVSGTTGAPVPIEIVSEANLDFENFKKRAEFREAFGGDGELYGRAGDEISRPGTPGSMTTMSTTLGGSSQQDRARSSSPASTRASSMTRLAEGTSYPRGYANLGAAGRDASPDMRGRPRLDVRLNSADITASGPPSMHGGDDDEDDDRGRLLVNAAGMGRLRPGSVGIAATPGERDAATGRGYFGLGVPEAGGSGFTSGVVTPAGDEEETSYDYFRRGPRP